MKDAMQKNQLSVRLTLSLISIFLILSCGGIEEKVKEDEAFQEWKDLAEKSQAHTPSRESHVVDVGPAQNQFTIGEEQEINVEKPLPTDKITLKMHDVELPVLLRALARAAGQNILINQNVTGLSSINIIAAPWNDVFIGLLHTHGLTYKWEGDIIRIVSIEDIRLNLDLAEADKKAMAHQREKELVEPLVTRIIRISYPKTERLKETLASFLTKNEEGKSRGSIMVDEHTNSIIIQAIREDIDRISTIVYELDKPTPQVHIEAIIVETSQGTARELGVQWGGLSRGSVNGKNVWVTGGNSGTWNNLGNGQTDYSLSTSADPLASWALSLPAASPNAFSIGLLYETIGKNILSFQLSALQEEGKLNILSSPSITTIDNEEAFIESGQEVPYETVSADGTNVEFKDALLSLKVVPHVISENLMKLVVETQNNEVTDETSGNNYPLIRKRFAKTTVVLYNGETTVIGGLSRQLTSKNNSGIPELKDIPVLGYLFGTKGDELAKEELLIFITPHILKTKR